MIQLLCMKKSKKGFTLAEMLIVVAIIGILVAIAALAISNSLERAREAVDLANIKSAFSELTEYVINNNDSDLPAYINKKTGYYYTYVKVTQKQKNWQSKNIELSNGKAVVNGATINADFSKNTDRAYKITVYTNTTEERTNIYLVNLMTISNTNSVHKNDMYFKTNEYVRER